jgi:hypothetical protein
MIEKIAGQAARARQRCSSIRPSLLSSAARYSESFVAHVAGDAEPPDQRFEAGDGIEAGAIGA